MTHPLARVVADSLKFFLQGSRKAGTGGHVMFTVRWMQFLASPRGWRLHSR